MEGFIGTVLLIIIIFYLLRNLIARLFPHFVMWLMKRQLKKQMGDAFAGGQQGGRRGSPFGGTPYSDQPQQRKKGKIFGKDVGEYVEFEEVSVYQSSDGQQTETHIKYKEESQISDADWEEVR